MNSVLDHMGSLLEGQTLLRPQDIERRRLEPGRLDQQLVSGSISRLRNPVSLLELIMVITSRTAKKESER
ncbi:MAG: hypothetical protein ACJ797_06500 [Ktedonobacteraceae bacterium]